MILDRETARKTAEFLLQIKAIKLQPNDPFTWASGWKSPIYCDNRLSLSYPPIRTYLRDEMAKAILTQYGTPNVIAGVATGAIAIGVLVAEKLNLPFVYKRSKSKEHGRQNQIEGHLERAQNVVIVEDLISTGMSSLAAHKALREADANVMGMAAIFTYGFDVAKQNFDEAGCDLVTLSDYGHLLERAEELDYVREQELETLRQWRANPESWGK
ncbi:MAG: orotate phosphoribosyltransferase [Flavobacteriales bacterium]|nr:orotate phosphoribosyltransferase [Flavobacteriales bacterium]